MTNTTYRNDYFENLYAFYCENKTEPSGYVAHLAIRAHLETKERGLDTYTVRETPFEQDMGEFMHIIEDEADIKEFNLCETSTGLMGCLHYLLNNGWTIIGVFEKEIDRFNTLRGLCIRKDII